MRKVPLLDLGNVVVQVDFSPFLRWLSERAGHGEPERVSSLLRSSLFFDFEFGQIARQEFARRAAKLCGAEFSRDELEENFCAIFPGLVEGVEPALEEMAEDGPVYCLTNTNEMHLGFLRRKFPVLSRFRRVFASHEMQRRKPYPGIYLEVARELQLDPWQIVFFDDLPANVEGALKAGMDAHLFQGVGPMLAVIEGIQEKRR